MRLKLGGKKDEIANASIPDQAHLQGPSSLENSAKMYKAPNPPDFRRKKIWAFWSIFWVVSLSLSLSLSSLKHTQKTFIYHFSQQLRGSVLAFIFLSLVLVPWI